MPFVIFHPHHQIIAGDTSIVDQDRRRTELFLDARQHRSDGFIAGDIEFQASTLNAVFLQGSGNALGP